MKKTDNKTLVEALRILARDIQSGDGVANACIAESADRIEELVKDIARVTSICNQRIRFENWYKKHYSPEDFWLMMNENDDYINHEVSKLWRGWKAGTE